MEGGILKYISFIKADIGGYHKYFLSTSDGNIVTSLYLTRKEVKELMNQIKEKGF